MNTLYKKLHGDLRAQRGAFFAVWLTMVLGLAAYGATYPAGIAMIDSFFATYDRFNYADFNVRTEAPIESAAIVGALVGIGGVEEVLPRLVYDIGYIRDEANQITLRMISLPENSRSPVNDIYLMDGDLITVPDEEILLLDSFANFHGIRPGDVLTLQIGTARVTRRVVGLVFAVEYVVAGQNGMNPFPTPQSFGVAFADQTALAGWLGVPTNATNDIVLTTTVDADEATIRTELEAAFTGLDLDFLYSRTQTVSGGVLDANINGNMAISAFFSAMFLIIGGLVMAVLLARLMNAEQRRIGTMRALGLKRGEVLRHYLCYPLIIGISGAIVGSIAGYLISYWVAAYFIQNLAGGSLPEWVNTPQWGYILVGAAVTIGLALLAGALPTWHASGTDPGLALRPVTPKGLGQQAQVSVRGLPLSAQQAIRNMLRVPVRTFNTLIGVTLGCVVIFAANGNADSSLNSVATQYRDGIRYQLRVIFDDIRPAAAYDGQILGFEGITDHQCALYGLVTARNGDRTIDTFVSSFARADDYVHFHLLDGEPAFSRQDVVWIGHNLARVLDLRVGDEMQLDALGQSVEVSVGGIVEQSIGSPVFVPTTLMQSWTPLGLHVANAALVRVEEGQLDAVRAALGQSNNVIVVENMGHIVEDITNYYGLYVNFSYVFMAFGYMLTLVVVFNTVSINLRERHEELLIMRSMGARLREIAAVITWETLSIVLIGIVISIPMGRLASDYLLGNYELDFFGMLTVIHPSSYALGIIGIVGIVVFAEWLSLRHLQHEDLGTLSKSLSM